MTMTKKDYELIATSIADYVRYGEKAIGETYNLKTVLTMTGWIAQSLASDNPKFDVAKFTEIVTKAVKTTQ